MSVPPVQSHATTQLIASWLNFFFYATEINLGIQYLTKNKPTVFHQTCLILALVFDTISSGVAAYTAHSYLVVFKGYPIEPEWSTSQAVPTILIQILTFTVSTITQAFFTHRYYMLSHNRIITAILVCLSITHTIFGWMAPILILTNSSKSFDFGVKATKVAAAFSAASDISIAGVMFIRLRTIHTTYMSTKNLLQRISIQAITCGIVTATATLLNLIFLYDYIPGFIVMYNILGRIYTLTLLINLILLQRMRNEMFGAPQNEVPGAMTDSIAFGNANHDRSFTIPLELFTPGTSQKGDATPEAANSFDVMDASAKTSSTVPNSPVSGKWTTIQEHRRWSDVASA
ncbi:hypothetical protein D9758_000026 [Tetrapyrgos nigripes]|uniref:DUF6534 domain-containing protein n=1 Tax=Tetrapyrgos nigripes TaxID=182062 RepID=A0A8H5H1Z7_9AGAR|nr:hypothetical protein D9758_000026 [Tetrapyrgos nigripes]